ncbi:syntaxin-18 isoform X2 [Chiloscyllium plagiosum]|uniref:syntaxin-18 isoform X2 n=1 Tax=Chiloscyllium plagiosum TaxID=36176 RepID=UPI001CB803B9|nr:syntaxin-18 isoform X2 [Chiloscyllium plagiosum]
MAADITLLFRASVKTVKTRNKAIGVSGEPVKEEILRKGRTRAEFTARAREVLNNISKLKDFLLEHRKDYINASSFVMSEYSRMTDMERDQIDQDAQVFMRTCSDAIHQLRAEAMKNVISPQVKEHREGVLDLLEAYLKNVCKVYSEQRAIRVKRVVDKKRLSRLEPEQHSNKTLVPSPENIPPVKPENSEELVAKDESNGKLKEKWLKSPGFKKFLQTKFFNRRKRLTAFMSSLWVQLRMLKRGMKTSERQSKIMLDFVCGFSSSW